MNKKCKDCGKMKPLTDFHHRSDSKDGVRNACKACKKITDGNDWLKRRDKKMVINKKYKQRNKCRVLAKMRDYRDNNRESIMLAVVKKRAKKIGVPFHLTIKDIVIPECCPLLGIKLKYNGTRNNRDSSPSIDRIVPRKGYVTGNIKVISYRANRIKNDATPEELILSASRIDEYCEISKEEKTVIEITT
jgi:hypothetical protein